MNKRAEVEKILSPLKRTEGDREKFNKAVSGVLKLIAGVELAAVEKVSGVECDLWEVDFEENWLKATVPQEQMDKGFTAGKLKIDFSDVDGGPKNEST